MQQRHYREVIASVIPKVESADLFQDPYKHIIIDNFFPANVVHTACNSFPKAEDDSLEFSNLPGIEQKYRSTWTSEFDIPDQILPVIRILNSAPFLVALSQKLAIPKLIPDPYFTGGGLNLMPPGSMLDVHVDGNYHDATGLHRRANVILYLNQGWSDGHGGEFEICAQDRGTIEDIKSIGPLFNRLIAFDSHDFSFHGVTNPPNFWRKSIILYYYTHDSRPGSQVHHKAPHSALWASQNFKDKNGHIKRSFK